VRFCEKFLNTHTTYITELIDDLSYGVSNFTWLLLFDEHLPVGKKRVELN